MHKRHSSYIKKLFEWERKSVSSNYTNFIILQKEKAQIEHYTKDIVDT